MGGSELEELKKYITNIPGFPAKGIIFRDVTSLLQSGEGFSAAVDEMLKQLDDIEFDAVLGLEARGFLFGAPVAYAKKKSFVPVRKRENCQERRYPRSMNLNTEKPRSRSIPTR